jgi:hypothetical protein
VAFEAVPSPDPKGKKVCSVIPEGFEALQWVAKPPADQPVRDELVLKTYAAWVTDPGELLAVFHQQAAAHRERLARYEADLRRLETRFGGTPPVTERELGSYATSAVA